MANSERKTDRRHQIALLVICLGTLVMGTGCQGFYFLTNPNQSEKVEAEYGRIGKRKVAVVVWADQSTLDVYPRSRERVCRAVTHFMDERLDHARFVTYRDIRKLQERTDLDWESLRHAALCKELDCDLVLRIDLLEFTMRASDTRRLRKGRVSGTLALYEGGPEEHVDAVYQSEVKATYPPKSIHGAQDLDEAGLLHETVDAFAKEVARKFYAHEVKLQDRPGW